MGVWIRISHFKGFLQSWVIFSAEMVNLSLGINSVNASRLIEAYFEYRTRTQSTRKSHD